MTAPKQPNLTTEEKEMIAYLLDQEFDQVNANLKTLTLPSSRTTINAYKVYKRHLGKTLNKIKGNKYSYNTDLR